MSPSCGGCVFSRLNRHHLLGIALGLAYGGRHLPRKHFKDYQSLKRNLARSNEDIEELKAEPEDNRLKYWKRSLENLEELRESQEDSLKRYTWSRRYERARDWYQRTFKNG